MTNCKQIDDYINLVRSGKYPCCKEQHQLCDFVERVFEIENIHVDQEQLDKYLSYQKYFPYRLFEWEAFLFALHNCTYKANGSLRFPILVAVVGRGAGKNGYLAFEDFCLLTPTNGVKKYHIDIFATSEDQAMASWQDVYDMLEENELKMKNHFEWNKEVIRNKKTGSEFRFRTSNYKSKDGGRQGKIDFDEYHAYENYKLIDVATTGLGKKAFPRRTIITTNGLIRGGPLDDEVKDCEAILNGEIPDNGKLPFICRLDDDKEVDDETNWHKANPSLHYLPHLMDEMRIEYSDYKRNPVANTSFMLKRMNRVPKVTEGEVTTWENILLTNQKIDESLVFGRCCVAGIDYMLTTDFLGAGLLYRINGKDIWITHSWVCRNSPDIGRIKAPIEKWAEMGLLTFVDDKEIAPDVPVLWLKNEAARLRSRILKVGIDKYKYTLMKKTLRELLYVSEEKEYNNVFIVRPSNEMLLVPIITHGFIEERYVWGDNPMMRWYCHNSKQVTSQSGNITYGKIEPKSRKTDGFKAFIAAEAASDVLDQFETVTTSSIEMSQDVFVY